MVYAAALSGWLFLIMMGLLTALNDQAIHLGSLDSIAFRPGWLAVPLAVVGGIVTYRVLQANEHRDDPEVATSGEAGWNQLILERAAEDCSEFGPFENVTSLRGEVDSRTKRGSSSDRPIRG